MGGVGVTYHFANVGSKSVMTRTMYNTHVRSLKNRFAIRIRRPNRKKKYTGLMDFFTYNGKYCN